MAVIGIVFGGGRTGIATAHQANAPRRTRGDGGPVACRACRRFHTPPGVSVHQSEWLLSMPVWRASWLGEHLSTCPANCDLSGSSPISSGPSEDWLCPLGSWRTRRSAGVLSRGERGSIRAALSLGEPSRRREHGTPSCAPSEPCDSPCIDALPVGGDGPLRLAGIGRRGSDGTYTACSSKNTPMPYSCHGRRQRTAEGGHRTDRALCHVLRSCVCYSRHPREKQGNYGE